MESIKSHRDSLTRDRTNQLDTRRPDSGLKGMSDPTEQVRKMKKSFDTLPLPPGVKQVGDAGLYGLEIGTKLGKYLGEKYA